MTFEERRELGRRWMACKSFAWAVGMETIGPTEVEANIVVSVIDGEPNGIGLYGEAEELFECARDPVPDVDSPATLGCLLRSVRKAWCDPAIAAVCAKVFESDVGLGISYRVVGGVLHRRSDAFEAVSRTEYPCEAVALIAALEASQL